MTLEHRKHFIVPFAELAERLGIDGEVLHVWREDDNDYLHVTAVNPDWPAIRSGSYVSPEIITAPERTVTSAVGTSVEFEELPFDARKLVEGLKGKKVGWLINQDQDGEVVAHTTVLHANVLEVPRVFFPLTPEALSDLIVRFEGELKLRLHTLVRWSSGAMNGKPFPSAFGVLFAE